MEQNIYIPGDLVMFNNEVVMINEVDNAAGDENPFIYITCTNKRKSFYERSSEVNPIPLTPEILKKNGWKKTDATWIYKREDSVTIFRLLDDKSYAAYIGNIRLLEFQFVHQLQHLLFGLGLDSNIKL